MGSLERSTAPANDLCVGICMLVNSCCLAGFYFYAACIMHPHPQEVPKKVIQTRLNHINTIQGGIGQLEYNNKFSQSPIVNVSVFHFGFLRV